VSSDSPKSEPARVSSEPKNTPLGNDVSREQGRAERRSIAGRAAIVASGTLFSRVLGLVREQVFAAMFTRAATDVFFVAFVIPNVLRQLFAEGAVQNGVLPVLTQVRRQHGEEQAQRFFQALRGLSLLLLLCVTAIGIVAAPWLVDLFAGGYRSLPGQYERTVTITRWVFPYIFFMGTAALGIAALNTYRRFVVSSYAPALLNVAFIVCALALPVWFVERGLDPLNALCVGVLSGGALQVVAQWPSLRKIGYLRWPRWNLHDQHVREVLRRMTPVLFGFGVYYVDVLVARHLLSSLGLGSLSYFGFAQRLCDFPQGIFVMAVQSATLPSLALLVASNNKTELVRTFSHGFRLALFVAVPASVLFTVLARPIVVLIFERGHFDADASTQTARALLAQGVGIWAVAAVRQLVIVFYALGDTRSPVWVAALDFVVFCITALVLREALGHVGVSWAVSAASFAQLGMLAVVLRSRLGSLDSRRIAKSLAKALGAALLAGWLAHVTVARMLADGDFGKLWPGILGCAVFGGVYLVGAWIARSEELLGLLAAARRRLA
jgi:putative peptidoglycan lipid II flippase